MKGEPGVPAIKVGKKRYFRLAARNARTGSAIAPELLNRIRPWIANEEEAVEWYRSHPIAELGNVTPRGLVETGRADLLFIYLDHIAEGGYA